MSIEFHNTGYGRRFFDGQLPQLIDALKTIGKEMKEQNRLARKALGEQEDDKQ